MFISIPEALIMHHICAKKPQNETDFQEHPGHTYFSVLERVYNDEIIIFRDTDLSYMSVNPG